MDSVLEWAEAHLSACETDFTHLQFLVQMHVTATIKLRASYFICLLSSDFNNSPKTGIFFASHRTKELVIPCNISGNSL